MVDGIGAERTVLIGKRENLGCRKKLIEKN